jgi:hypothetical protein
MGSSGQNYVVLLVDESAGMSSVMRDKTADGTESVQTNAQRVATSINNLLRQLGEGPPCDVAVIGYRSDGDGQADVGARWTGVLTGTEFVLSSDLPGMARVEQRTRKVPQPDGLLREESVSFSVWYEPSLGTKAPQIAAFNFCHDLVNRRTAERGGQGIVVHVFTGASSDGNPQRVIDEMLRNPGGPILVQCHVAGSSALVTTAFPSKQAFVASGMARDLFSRASELPEAFRDFVKSFKVPIQTGARGLVHNAKMGDLYRCLQLAKLHVASNAPSASGVNASASPTTSSPPTVASEPPGTAASASGPALLVLILDRSVDDPYAGTIPNACSRLSEAGNECLKLITSRDLKDLPVDAAIISYGQGSDGTADVRTAFDGPLAGKSVVRNTELLEGAIRIEEAETQVSNGAGGLITMTKKTPIFFDVEPAASSPPQLAFTAAVGIADDWLAANPTGQPPRILHLTRGRHAAADVEAAAAALDAISDSRRPVLQHLVITESPHKSLAYPDSDSELDGEDLKALWRSSAAVPHWDTLQAAKRPYISATSKAFVINGKFDILGDELREMLEPTPALA